MTTKGTWTLAVGATLLWTGATLATPTVQNKCDNARILAWKKYQSCVNGVVAKEAKGKGFDDYAAFAKCRHKYFGKWAKFQSYTGSTCVGARYTDNGDQTVTDNLSGLVWEKKDNLDGTTNPSDPHDADNTYTWSTGSPYKESGTAFTGLLGTVNGGGGFGGANGWRLPTLAELQTIVLDFECKGRGLGPTCSCPSSPCVDLALDAATTQPDHYWSATSSTCLAGIEPCIPAPGGAWRVGFTFADVFTNSKTLNFYVRAVRGGL